MDTFLFALNAIMPIILLIFFGYFLKKKQFLDETWFKKGNKQRLELSGGAGTGKSTTISAAIDAIGLKPDEVLFTAPTGKAAQVLTRKGCFTKTIHSTM